MASRKRSKELTKLIAEVNANLRNREVKSEQDELFIFWCNYLVANKQYEGFNFFKDAQVYNSEGSLQTVSVLAGSPDPAKFDYLQIY